MVTKISSTNEDWEIILSPVDGGSIVGTRVFKGEYPHFAFANQGVVYLKDDDVYYYNIANKTDIKIVDFDVKTRKDTVIELSYSDEREITIVKVSSLNEKTLFPETNLYLYQLNLGEGSIEANLVSHLRLNDALARSAVLSPGGQYLAMTLTETNLGRSPRVLIFDIISGIIKKEIPLEPFRSDFMFLDTWSLFN
ncbi:MAG: hypothetical protein R3B53_03045 [Candidatus Paceibacterota bacterium]